MTSKALYAPEDDEKKEELNGYWSSDRNTIVLRTISKDFTRSAQIATFWHEAMHAILDLLSYDELSSDEKFVDRTGQAIHQILTTKKGNVNE